MAINGKRASATVKRKSAAALAVAATVFVGLAYASPAQNAFAHNFSHTETTEFLAAVEMTKAYVDLARVTTSQDREIAKIYAEKATTFLDEHWMNEIAERNQRIATDLSASLNQLPASIEEGQSATVLREEVRDIKNLVAEAVSVRIDRSELANSTTQSLVTAKVLSESMFQYELSQGVEEDLAYELAYGIKKMSEMDDMGMNHGDMNITQQKAAKGLASKALYIGLTKVKKSDATDSSLVDAAKMAMRQVKGGIDKSEPWQDVIGTMHQGVHENLRLGFNLQMQMQMQ
jgi:hypothetical protein